MMILRIFFREQEQNYNELHNPKNHNLTDKEFYKKFKPDIIDKEGDQYLKKMKEGYFLKGYKKKMKKKEAEEKKKKKELAKL